MEIKSDVQSPKMHLENPCNIGLKGVQKFLMLFPLPHAAISLNPIFHNTAF